jgi:hypothetical protein
MGAAAGYEIAHTVVNLGVSDAQHNLNVVYPRCRDTGEPSLRRLSDGLLHCGNIVIKEQIENLNWGPEPAKGPDFYLGNIDWDATERALKKDAEPLDKGILLEIAFPFGGAVGGSFLVDRFRFKARERRRRRETQIARMLTPKL